MSSVTKRVRRVGSSIGSELKRTGRRVEKEIQRTGRRVEKEVSRSSGDIRDAAVFLPVGATDLFIRGAQEGLQQVGITPDYEQMMKDQEKRAEQQAAEQQAEVEEMEAEARRRRQSELRRALEPRAGMFDLLGTAQRDTLG